MIGYVGKVFKISEREQITFTISMKYNKNFSTIDFFSGD